MAKLKISADTSDVKKSLLDLSRSLKDLKVSKVTLFSQEDKRFIKQEMKKEIVLIKQRIKDNREELSKLVDEQKKVTKGSQEELEIRKKILDSYKNQAKLGKQLGSFQKDSKKTPGGGGIMDHLTGGVGGLLGTLGKFTGLGALATGAFAVMKGVQATDQYVGGAPSRNRLKGLGVDDENFGSPTELARVGLTEQDMIQRRADATAVLGREGTNQETEKRKAGFERAYGLEGGTMTSVAAQFRGQVGGKEATDLQMKLQASILAAGIEDAIGPYLDSAVSLLTSINENGTANTTEIMGLMAQLSKDGERTPEQLSKMFQGINGAVKGASGEQSAFLQTAFSRANIGGGTVGGTKFAMSSGGMMGMDRKQLEKRGYNKDLLNNMEGSGMFKGVNERSGAIMQQFKESGGLKKDEKISDIKDTNRMVGMGNLANSVFNTKGEQGFDVLMMLEKVQNKQMNQKQFDKKLKDMQESNDPVASRLDKINNTLSGQTELLRSINTNLMENLGKEGVVAANALTKGENVTVEGATNLAGAVNSTGIVEGSGNMMERAGNYVNKGGLASDAYDFLEGDFEEHNLKKQTSDEAIGDKRKEMMKQWHPDWSQEQIDQRIKDKPLETNPKVSAKGSLSEAIADNSQKISDPTSTVAAPQVPKSQSFPSAREIGKEVANALKQSPISNNISVKNRIQLPDGGVTERTNK